MSEYAREAAAMKAAEVTVAPAKPAETDEHLYARQTRNAVVTMAVIMVLSVIVSLIVGLVIVHTLSPAAGGSTPTPDVTCSSQGGWDSTC
jgi:hypothetical protein